MKSLNYFIICITIKKVIIKIGAHYAGVTRG